MESTEELQTRLLKRFNDEEMQPKSWRTAFVDREFLSRRETRGIRMQLEMLKPDVIQQEHGIDNTIVVFGSARFKSQEEAQEILQNAEQRGDAGTIAHAQRLVRNAKYYEAARQFGYIVAKHNVELPESEHLFICTGGGPGVMEAANRGAHEAGDKSVGLTITLPREEAPNPYVTPDLCFKFHYFAMRKMHFVMRAKALVAFAGGFGTLDELFEILTLVQTRKTKPVPIFLFGTDYWKRVINFEALAEEGVIAVEDLNLFRYVDDPHECWHMMQEFFAKHG